MNTMPEARNINWLAERLLDTPDSQPDLWKDRLNDLEVAIGEYHAHVHKWYTGSLDKDWPEVTLCQLCGLVKS